MTDYVAIALQGFSTGIGVIIAHEFWEWLKQYRSRMKHELLGTMNRYGEKLPLINRWWKH
jgi:hypothetical protein